MSNETVFDFTPGQEHQVFHFATPSAQGTVAVEVGEYGLSIFVAPHRRPVALVDLYGAAQPESSTNLGAGHPALVVEDPASDEPLAYIYERPEGALLVLDPSVSERAIPGNLRGFCHPAQPSIETAER